MEYPIKWVKNLEGVKVAMTTLPKSTMEDFVNHLVEIEESRGKLFEEFFPEPSAERNEIESLIEKYISEVNEFIKGVSKNGVSDIDVPFVTVCSEVEIEDVSENETFKYRIVSPFRDSIKAGDISFLSPVGKALLLKRVGDEVEVKAPGGVFRYLIKSIRFVGDMRLSDKACS